MRLKVVNFLLFFLLFSFLLFSQDIDKIYIEGKKFLENNDFENSIKIIDLFITNYPENIKTKDLVVSFIRKSPSQYFTNKVTYAEFLSERFPFDSVTNNIRVEMANTYINKKLYFESFKWIYEVFKFTTENSPNKTNALKNLQNLIKSYLNESELEYIYYNFSDDSINPLILLTLFKIYKEKGELEKSEVYKQKLIKEYPESEETKRELFGIKETKQSKIKIALLLQLTGDMARFGEQILRGCAMANEDENIVMNVFDTEGSNFKTLLLIDSIFKDKSYVAVIGPLTSQETAIVGSYLFNGKILPVFTPTATDGDLLNFEDNIFLLNRTLIEEAIFTAQIIKKDSTIKNVGIIYPDDSFGRSMSSAFKRESKKLGINIVFDIIYTPGTQDFIEKIDLIKKMNFDAIYLPTNHEDAILLTTQLAFKDINCYLYGSSLWYNDNLIRLAKDYLKKTYIIYPRVADDLSPGIQNFKLNYYNRYNEEPDRFVILSYDLFKFLSGLLKSGVKDRKGINDYVKNVQDYKGVSGRISFKKNRLNFDVYYIKNSNFVKKEF
ncbi:MAG: penicillin-binding protein activator [candidate division WOR-3 bacterium]